MDKEQDAIAYARDLVGRDPMARHLGIDVLAVKKDYARLGLTVRAEYLNALDRAHGIIVYALVDQAIAVAANASVGSAMLLESKINYLNGAPQGARLVAEAVPVARKRRIGLWSVMVRQEENNLLIAAAQGTSYHKE